MSPALNEIQHELISKILFAVSQEDVKHFCDSAMTRIKDHNIHGHKKNSFIDRIIYELDEFNPMDKDAQQWSNIHMARIYFNRIKLQLNAATHS